MDLRIDENEPEKSTQSNKFKPTSIMFDKAKRQKRKELALAYCIHVDWSKAAKEVGMTKKDAVDLFDSDQSFRRMVQSEMERRAQKLEVSADWVLSEIKGIAIDARADNNYKDALKALELIGKHLKLFTEQKQQNDTKPIAFNFHLGDGSTKTMGITLDAEPETVVNPSLPTSDGDNG